MITYSSRDGINNWINVIAKPGLLLAGLIIVPWISAAQQQLPDMPMEANEEHTIKHEQAQKQVLDAKPLGSSKSFERWEHQGYGQLSVSGRKYRTGNASLLLESPTKGEVSTMEDGFTSGRPWGGSSAVYTMPGENLEKWNRISFWIYPDLPGFEVVSINMMLHNEGEEKVPGPYNRNGLNYEIVENQQWNKVYWNIEHLGRDKVTGVEIRYRLQGNQPGAADTVDYYIDDVNLEKVEPRHYEGWQVAPGHIAYNHLGYVTDMPKRALASDLQAGTFSLVDELSGNTIVEKPIQTRETPIGSFQYMDFSEVQRPGTYVLKAGDRQTRPFTIGTFGEVYRSTIVKTINHYYAQRCGYDVPGIHDVCHVDWTSVHDGKTIPINGGWHDAGDLSQGLTNTAEGAHAQMALAEELRYSDPVISDRLLEEAQWGLDWLLKTRFGDGYRPTWSTMDFWTDGIIGTVDDVPSEAENDPRENFMAARTEAKAAMALRQEDPKRARYALKSAVEDWRYARQKAGSSPEAVELAAVALNASLTLYEATGEEKYKEAAITYGDVILQSQQQQNLTGDIDLKGFFYRSPGKETILHYAHRGHEQDLVIGLVRLSRKFPDHSRKADWNRALSLYADYYKKISDYTDPYFMLPAGVYDLQDADDEVERKQIQSGFRLSDRYYLKSFPTWKAFRGNSGTILSQAKGLSVVAEYLGDRELRELAYSQLDWHLGLNPFNQSLMYGAGYRFAAQYSAMSGNIVGGLPVGVQTHFNRDVPYWPAENVYNWKEIWVHPSNRWLWIMADFM